MWEELLKSLDWHINTKVEKFLEDKTMDVVKKIHEKIEEFWYSGRLIDSIDYDEEDEELIILYSDWEQDTFSFAIPKDWYTPKKWVDYFDGKDYILTEKDKKDIWTHIKVPVVEKIIEKTETIETKEVAKYETAQQIKKKLEALEWDDRISAKAIKWLQEFVSSWYGGAIRLDMLMDVHIRNVEDGQTLVFNKERNQFVNATWWGWWTRWSIGGTLSDQEDLQQVLNEKLWETFETVSKNLKGNPYTLNYTSGKLTSIIYTLPSGTITKTLNYTGDKLTNVVLSGAIPIGIQTTKNLAYTDDTLSTITYS